MVSTVGVVSKVETKSLHFGSIRCSRIKLWIKSLSSECNDFFRKIIISSEVGKPPTVDYTALSLSLLKATTGRLYFYSRELGVSSVQRFTRNFVLHQITNPILPENIFTPFKMSGRQKKKPHVVTGPYWLLGFAKLLHRLLLSVYI